MRSKERRSQPNASGKSASDPRDAYLVTLDPDVRENTFKDWREGR
jgi:hypothetical protein